MYTCRAGYLWLAVVVLLGMTSLLGACGSKGDLYLPKQNSIAGQINSSTEPTR